MLPTCDASGKALKQVFGEKVMLSVLKTEVSFWSLFELVADSVLCFAGVFLAARRLPEASFDGIERALALPEVLFWAGLSALFMALLYSFAGLYRQGAIQVGLKTSLRRGLIGALVGITIGCLSLHLSGSGKYVMLLLLYTLPVMAVGVIAVRGAGYFARRSSLGLRRVLIVGAGAEAEKVARELASSRAVRYCLLGFYPVQSGVEQSGVGAPAQEAVSAPVFLSSVSIPDIVLNQRVDEVIVAVREQRGAGVPLDQLLACRLRGIPVLDLPGFYERARGEVPTDSLKASWLIYGHGFAQSDFRNALKRCFDILSASVLLVLALPIMLVTSIAIKLESDGPVIYRQERVGLAGRSFMCLKFRSMRNDAEKDGMARWAVKNDARITRVGSFIRKCRIDELPQLLSVLQGHMSLVGPRPERPSFVAELRSRIPFYDIRHSVKPGVTGWAQVRYSYGATVEDARRKHQFDLFYVKNHSLWLDLLILMETVTVVLFGEGAQ